MTFRPLWMVIVFLVILPLQAETPFNWGKEELLARRLELIQQARQPGSNADSLVSPETPEKKVSVGKAALFSALLPGSGEFYARSYIKAAAFLAVEVTAWAVNVSYKKKGDDKDVEFKAYADAHWDEYRYWSYVNWVASNDPDYANIPLFPYDPVMFLIPEDYYNANRDLILSTLREIEGQEFSHRLPYTKTQQYYEMIGKYPGQFGNAWDDASFDRKYSGPDNITANNNFYMDMRDESNRFYDVAQYGLMVALINHVVSAVDAGFTARNYNRRQVKMEASYHQIRYKGEYMNMLGVNVTW